MERSCPLTDTQITTHHEVMRLWVDFPGQGSGDVLDEITWEAFFDKFDDTRLAFLYEVHTADGSLSRFCKFVDR